MLRFIMRLLTSAVCVVLAALIGSAAMTVFAYCNHQSFDTFGSKFIGLASFFIGAILTVIYNAIALLSVAALFDKTFPTFNDKENS